ncbi:hypothetical protein [Schumannella sp. 10F1B-5-1]|uniref:hypothetical protein n=1 Tax=Schumannella sp. 10F1B-5-1 TaxID=2590780 RepID=UPI0011316A25|nr:hypothetical protein [Schumannella sp. 10F1B-5-1]TPW71069.1 hypothetical protein FJ658_13360 [Schumannella sp. 10F1B-5-1]
MAADSSTSPVSSSAALWSETRTGVWAGVVAGDTVGRVEQLANGFFAVVEPNTPIGLFPCLGAAQEAVLASPRPEVIVPTPASARPAESYEQLTERLAAEHPTLTTGQIETIMTEEHDLLMGIDPADIVPPIVVEATLERVEQVEARQADAG